MIFIFIINAKFKIEKAKIYVFLLISRKIDLRTDKTI